MTDYPCINCGETIDPNNEEPCPRGRHLPKDPMADPRPCWIDHFTGIPFRAQPIAAKVGIVWLASVLIAGMGLTSGLILVVIYGVFATVARALFS